MTLSLPPQRLYDSWATRGHASSKGRTLIYKRARVGKERGSEKHDGAIKWREQCVSHGAREPQIRIGYVYRRCLSSSPYGPRKTSGSGYRRKSPENSKGGGGGAGRFMGFLLLRGEREREKTETAAHEFDTRRHTASSRDILSSSSSTSSLWPLGLWCMGQERGRVYIYVRSLRFKAGALRSCPRLLRYPNYYELRACARRYNSSWNVTVLPRVGTHLEQKKEKIGLDFFLRVTYTYSYLIMV